MSYANWSPSVTYIINDIVEYAGFIYTATAINLNVLPLPTTVVWLLSGGSGGGGVVNTITASNTNVTIGGTPSNVTIAGTLQTLTHNVAGSNKYIAGMLAPPFGTSAIVCAGTGTFLIESAPPASTALLVVASSGVLLAGAGTVGAVPCQVPDVLPYTTSDLQSANTRFVQNAIALANPVVINNNTNTTCYPTFVSATGGVQPLYADSTTTAFSYNPNTSAITVGTTLKLESIATGIVAVGIGAGATLQGIGGISIGFNSGQTSQGNTSIAIGYTAGQTNQNVNAIAIGTSTGQTSQGTQSIAIGQGAGQTSQGNSSVAIGNMASNSTQGTLAVAIGDGAGQLNQGAGSVSIGFLSGNDNQGGSNVAVGQSSGQTTQGAGAVAIGLNAGQTNQGDYSIAIGCNASAGGAVPNSICINASSLPLNPARAGFFCDPVRGLPWGIGVGRMFYDASSLEISYSTT